jgi:poly-gamma-glutamate synthesis protein (capsule biosynthesis protein)
MAEEIFKKASKMVKLFLGGDVMTGRGVDQILPNPGSPAIHESFLKSARDYVRLAEELHGPIPKPVNFSYIWGDALAALESLAPDVRMINLETSVTRSDSFWEGKGIHYRMSPENIGCLTAARIDICSLANNHVLDWGYRGLMETLETLKKANINSAGAGQNLKEAEAPAAVEMKNQGRVLAFSWGAGTSGIPLDWGASRNKPGVNLLPDFSRQTVHLIQKKIQARKNAGDLAVASIHWGGNWGYEVSPGQRSLAHGLIEEAGVDVIHGHSSHHLKGIEVYREKLILYGCGDLINDYEGIGGYEWFRSDLALMYFAGLDPSTGRLIHLQMTPMQMRNFRLNRVSRPDAQWLRDTLSREGEKFGTRVKLNHDNTLTLEWSKP